MLLGTSIFMDTHYYEHPAAFINTQATIMNQHPILLQTPTIMASHAKMPKCQNDDLIGDLTSCHPVIDHWI